MPLNSNLVLLNVEINLHLNLNHDQPNKKFLCKIKLFFYKNYYILRFKV